MGYTTAGPDVQTDRWGRHFFDFLIVLLTLIITEPGIEISYTGNAKYLHAGQIANKGTDFKVTTGLVQHDVRFLRGDPGKQTSEVVEYRAGWEIKRNSRLAANGARRRCPPPCRTSTSS